MSSLRSFAVALLVAVVAGPAGAFTISVVSDGGGSRTYSGAELGCEQQPDTTFACSSSGIDTSAAPYSTEFWVMDSWNFTSNADPFIIGNIALVNPGATTQRFTLLFNQATGPFGPNNVMGGSVQGGLTADAGGGTLSVPTGSFFYRGLIDGLPVAGADLYGDPFSVSAGGFGSANVPALDFGTPIPSLAAPDVTSTIGIQLDFELTAGDQASFTSVFVVETPEPSAVALLGFGLVALGLRARR